MNEKFPILGKENKSRKIYKGTGAVALVTLGCAKNQVDSEVMLGRLKECGYEIVNDLNQADIAIVNTCGFLESAVKEGVDCILDVAEYKKSSKLSTLVVAGCMVERYGEDLKKELKEVDAFMGIDDILELPRIIDKSYKHALNPTHSFLYDHSNPRVLPDNAYSAYVKISDGCDRTCAFCTIPKIRGAMRSRVSDSVLQEIAALGAKGIREVNLIGQDLTAYGKDNNEISLAALLKAIAEQKAVDWIRLLYAYPTGVSDELLDTIQSLDSLCDYIDIPLQHSSEAVLKSMHRPLGKYLPRELVAFISKQAPAIALRSTFIVGFPGETEADIADLEAFVLEGHFLNLGVFTYSKEEGTAAYALDGEVAEELKEERKERLMLAQQKVNEAKLGAYIGKKVQVLVEGPHPESDLLLSARTRFQAPEVDGTVIINDISPGCENVRPGSIAELEISEVAGYDLVGRLHNIVKL